MPIEMATPKLNTNHTLITMTTKINSLAYFNHFSFFSFYDEKMKHKKGGGFNFPSSSRY